ncbi:AAA domain-containing protein [Xanthomonas citri pv. malvacearum]|uniref:Phospholipase n=1 Tax=Xanthomonas campestris pv. malvacearum TaxID=86040 RepID=A0AA45BV97_XANCM|nr:MULTISPECIES: AAA domain-containing protein [Xanthomonas]AOL20340.1 phospholipase [Xanthomonas citri pv. malvacearum]ASN02227.1 phospholipase [Xanthomonas citri pv. malvacearum]ASY85421.1 phospholipase [Xanthomonas citri pv. malvacearum]ASY89625.1 phospholipase [Xanthomonas citri pv. malvacearum]EKQ64090.1 phospholipase D/transphosphatidylase [Xanthomonas citri pv. malvacearum str. GSPB1386]
MRTDSLAYAGYWRNSLADSEAGNGAFQATDTKEFQLLSRVELDAGRADQATIDASFAKEAEQTQFVEVVIRPKVYVSRLEHGKQRRTGAPAIVAPAMLARDGRLHPLSRTVVPRDILEPLERGTFSIGSVSDQDAYLTTNTVAGIDVATDDGEPLSDTEFDQKWASYIAACDQLLEQVTQGWPGAEDEYELAEHGYLLKKESFSASQHIIALYDHIRASSPTASLFDRYASTDISPPEHCLPEHAEFSQRLGHSSDQFPLAPAQRDALAHLLAAETGEILAVNGPPGTGKTTLLLSVVATLWAKAAIADGYPPVVLAASTNNQAVTNIIDAFGKDFSAGDGPLAGRWLPRVNSFGAYFPSASKEAEAAQKYQTHSFFEAVESDAYVTEAQKAYIDAAAAAFPNITKEKLDVRAAVDALRTAIQTEAKKLAAIESAWSDLDTSRAAIRAELGEEPSASMTQRRQKLEAAAAEKRITTDLSERWEHYLAQEPLLYTLFSWLPPVAKKRTRLARQFLKQIWPSQHAHDALETIEQIEAAIKTLANQVDRALRERTHSVERGDAVLKMERDCLTRWQAALVPIGASDRASSLSMADCDPLADMRIRFTIFLLTTHYWEGRWLLEIQELLPQIAKERKKTGRVAVEKRWRRRMKLTPCIVSTLYMLPKEMLVSRHDGIRFVPDYLYDFADLLIVDEAGQVLPEVAGASFALSKKTLVIGDTLQIEPIWSIPPSVDIGNLLNAKLLSHEDHEDGYDRLSEIGKTVARGSVMRIAQALTRYHYDPDLARGMFLHEHRRCFDEIISYCNELCYQGKLLAKRGPKAEAPANEQDGLPAMGYLHIDGICQKSSGGSRRNAHEAETIAAWLAEHRASLEATYGQPLHKVVGVVTPFGGQVQAISNACRSAGIEVGNDDGGVTVGTVHSLQGAERPVVIFSPTYTKHANGGFIDRSPSMLNVAVSRAKSTFMVFGDMDVFEAAPKATPRGLLAPYLFRDSGNALHFEQRMRQDLRSTGAAVRPLRDAQEHDAFLLDALAKAGREIHIVSPWIILERIEEIGALEAMYSAVQRGVKVTIYTDPELNAGSDTERRQALLAAARILRGAGIQVAFVARVHSKVLLGDDDLYCVGSFNWFSARRDEQYARHETSLAYRGAGLVSEIEVMQASLRDRIMGDQP